MVVVLPLPVGPEVSTIPLGRLIPCSTARSDRPARPISLRSKFWPVLSSKRITTCSPHITGLMAIRRSISLSATLTPNWPSCGTRCSSILSSARILTRLTRAGSRLFGRSITWRSKPSIRKRITSLSSVGSMWISLALVLAAYSKIVLSARLIGESCTIVFTRLASSWRVSCCDASAAASTAPRSVLYWAKTWRTLASEAMHTFSDCCITVAR